MAFAFTVTPLATAQSPQIFISDGSDECTAALVSLQVDTDNGNVTATVDSLEDCGGPGTPSITSFTVNGSASGATVNEGVALNVSWDSVNTTSCASSGTLSNWASLGSLASSGTRVVSTTGLSNGNYSLTLSCSSAQGTIQASNNPLTATIQNSSSTNACDSRPPPPGMTRASTITVDFPGNAFFFGEVFGPWPGNGNSIRLRIPNSQYVAWQFTTGNHPSTAQGEMQIVPVSLNNTATGPKMWSVSQCPGDFRPFVIDDEMGPGCVKGPTQGQFRFGGTSFRSSSTRCALEPNTTYFLNMLYTDDPIPTNEQQHGQLSIDCSSLFCGDSFKASVLGF